MRSSPTFSETKFNLSFFLTTPAKKPRTECCCHSVAFMIAAIVVPFGCRSIPRTVSCFDEVLVDLLEVAFGVVTLDTAADLVALRFPAEDRTGRDCLAMRFADFDSCLLMATWLSLCQRQRQALPLTQAPRSGGARGGETARCLRRRRFSSKAALRRRRLLRSAARYPSSRYERRCARLHRPAADLAMFDGDSDAPGAPEVEQIQSNLVAHIARLRS